ncbi:MAG: GNAT family protein [Anaerolineales bacterium]|nr:GNAT family protein [Anaerolineales bacterium]MDP2778216.1 GNAT family protein [Anaerolineales bacterium]
MSMIYGERVRLRAVEREDVKKFYEWVNDPEVTRGLALYLPMSMTDEENWFNSMKQRDPKEKPLAIEVRKGKGWKLIGNCGVFGIEHVNSSAELGIMIGDKSEWDKGYGSEVMTLLLRHCFETLNLNRAYVRVYTENIRAVRSYEKAGFVLEGRLREAVYKIGKYEDVLFMSVLRSEWVSRRKEE